MAQLKTIEVAVTANPKHKGIVDLKLTGSNERGQTTSNGITWRIGK